jgi:hypothetical protein
MKTNKPAAKETPKPPPPTSASPDPELMDWRQELL